MAFLLPILTIIVFLVFLFFILMMDVFFSEIRLMWCVITGIFFLYYTYELFILSLKVLFGEEYYSILYRTNQKNSKQYRTEFVIRIIDIFLSGTIIYASMFLIFYLFDQTPMKNFFFDDIFESLNPSGGNFSIWVQFLYFSVSFTSGIGAGPVNPVHPASQAVSIMAIVTFFFYRLLVITTFGTFIGEIIIRKNDARYKK